MGRTEQLQYSYYLILLKPWIRSAWFGTC